MDLEGLTCKTFNRGPEWFEYIYGNRNGVEDVLSGTDVIRGPIANDTIYDTLGVTTSGFLSKGNSLRLLMVGPEYIQIALKTQKAADHLKWTGSYILSSAEIKTTGRLSPGKKKRFRPHLPKNLQNWIFNSQHKGPILRKEDRSFSVYVSADQFISQYSSVVKIDHGE